MVNIVKTKTNQVTVPKLTQKLMRRRRRRGKMTFPGDKRLSREDYNTRRDQRLNRSYQNGVDWARRSVWELDQIYWMICKVSRHWILVNLMLMRMKLFITKVENKIVLQILNRIISIEICELWIPYNNRLSWANWCKIRFWIILLPKLGKRNLRKMFKTIMRRNLKRRWVSLGKTLTN